MTALPTGSWSANGLKFWGETGGLEGFGIKKSQPCRHESGILGGLEAHQSVSFAWSNGAKKDACWRQTMPGENGFATALLGGI